MTLPRLGVVAVVCTLVAPAFASQTTVWLNDPLDFQLTETDQSDNISFCDVSKKCLTFSVAKAFDGTITTYIESTGKCVLTIQTFDKSFAEGITKSDFMLEFLVQVVKVTSGEEKGVPQQNNAKVMRSLTGIYR